MKSSILGLGEVGGALFAILKEFYPVQWFDKGSDPNYDAQIMHICFPQVDGFVDEVARYADIQKPTYIVIHSSVEVGTTIEIHKRTGIFCFHSPIRGKHPDMVGGIKTYTKYISYDFDGLYSAELLRGYFRTAGIPCEIMKGGTKVTELAKLLELSRYGVYIAFAKEQERICKDFGVDYVTVVNDYEESRTSGLKSLNAHHLIQPILYPFKDYVGGHCTVEDMEILLRQGEYPLLRQAYEIDRGTVIWRNCNIYKTAKIGKGCSIGSGTEIGNNVKIGNNVRIGAQCFIPEGVTIEDDVFIAPKVTMSNDKHPPSNQACWGKILIKKGAAIGMGSIILPDVTIGEGAIIGAGAVVTKNVPNGEKWYGVPAMPHGVR